MNFQFHLDLLKYVPVAAKPPTPKNGVRLNDADRDSDAMPVPPSDRI